MPHYDFECENLMCPKPRFTVKHSFQEPHPDSCPTCTSPIRQIFYPIPAIYKGSGFFTTDNKKDTRVRGESGVLGRRVSETDVSNIDEETPTRTGAKGQPLMTPTRPVPVEMKPKDIIDEKLEGGITKRTHVF